MKADSKNKETVLDILSELDKLCMSAKSIEKQASELQEKLYSAQHKIYKKLVVKKG